MNRNKKRQPIPLWKKLALTALLTASLAPAWTVSASSASDQVNEVLGILSKNHVSGVSEEALSQSAIKAMVDSLNDPYTQYMDKKDYNNFMNSLSRSYVGVGIQISKAADGIYIEQVFAGAPAEGAGLQAGDKIIKVNDKQIVDESTDELVNLVLGEENTKVSITVQRGEEQLAKTMQRKAVSLPVVDSAYLDGGVGYLRIHSFSDDSDELFAESLAGMKEKSDFRSLVIDLRDNGGGLLESAGNIAGQFIKDKVLIHTKTRTGADEPVRIVGGTTVSVPVYVLVNGNSASASEVLAGALQDYDVAVIAGTQTYGKGSVQNIYPLKDGSMLKVTIEEYYTPNGHPVNKVGITPDLKEEGGGMSQLLSVLRKAGVNEFTVAKTRSLVKVNGMQVSDVLPVFEEGGHVWVHSRVLAAAVGADVQWLPETESVQIAVAGGNTAKTFSPAQGDAQFAGDLLYIDVAAFAKQFPQLSVEGTANNLIIHAAAGN